MAHLIDKDALVAEIKNLIERAKAERVLYPKTILSAKNHLLIEDYKKLLSIIDTLEVKEVQEYEQPDYSCFETTYKCGKKPHWSIGDTLAYYESYSDREGECVLGKITKVECDEEQCDWLYTFEGGSVYDEQSLLEDETYKKK